MSVLSQFCLYLKVNAMQSSDETFDAVEEQAGRQGPGQGL